MENHLPILTLSALGAVLLSISRYCAHLVLTGGARIPLTVRPENMGLPHEKTCFKTADGVTLRGWFIPARAPSDRTIILCHGWGGNKGEILKYTGALRDRGFNLFYFDFRFCGESEGNLSSVGYLEAGDFDAAVRLVKSRRPHDRLGVYGLSMGAMVALAGLARHPGIEAAVLESPFASHNQAVARYAWTTKGIPFYPLMPLIFFWMRRTLGGDPESAGPERLAPLLKDVAVLMIHGSLDAAAPPEIGKLLLKKFSGSKQLWIVPGAGHARCAAVAGPAYQDRLAEFYTRHLPSDIAA
jgi:pimeloyl-ACP methyl ester carboxylesterase